MDGDTPGYFLEPLSQAGFHWESQSLQWKYTVTLGHTEEINC